MGRSVCSSLGFARTAALTEPLAVRLWDVFSSDSNMPSFIHTTSPGTTMDSLMSREAEATSEQTRFSVIKTNPSSSNKGIPSKLVDSIALRDHFRPRFDRFIPGHHDAILQAKDGTCFYCNVRSLGSLQLSASIAEVANPTSGFESAAVELPLIRLEQVDGDVIELLVLLFDPGETSRTEYLSARDWYDQQYYNLIIGVLSLIKPYNLMGIPPLLVHALSTYPFTQYAIAAASGRHRLATVASTRLAESPRKPSEIPDLPRTILEKHAPTYIRLLTDLWEARAKSEDFYRLNLMFESVEFTNGGARNRCTKHASNGQGLRPKDYRPFHQELIRQIDADVHLLDPTYPSLEPSNAALRQLVCNVVGCGYHPCIKPLHDHVMLARNIRMHFFPKDIDFRKQGEEDDELDNEERDADSDSDDNGGDRGSDDGEVPTQEELHDLMMIS